MIVTRQQLTDCIVAAELRGKKNAEPFPLAWLFLTICMNDTIGITPALRDQLYDMFSGFPRTWKNIQQKIGE